MAGTKYFPVRDDLGTPLALLDETGSVVEKYVYSSSGICRVLAPNDEIKTFDHDDNPQTPQIPKWVGDFGNAFGFAGMWIDEHTGLSHTHFRDYSPTLGRWMTQDPAGYADGLNLYAYYAGVNGIDPLGLESSFAEDMWVALFNPFAVGGAGLVGAGKGLGYEVVGVGKMAYGATVGLGEQVTLTGIDVANTYSGADEASQSSVFNFVEQATIEDKNIAGEAALTLSGYRFGNQIYENLSYGAETGDYSGFSENMGQFGFMALSGAKAVKGARYNARINQMVNNLKEKGQIAAPKGTMSTDSMYRITKKTGREVALLREEGNRILKIGTQGEVIVTGASRIIAHTHPRFGTFTNSLARLSGPDIEALQKINQHQRSSIVIDSRGNAVREHIDGPYANTDTVVIDWR